MRKINQQGILLFRASLARYFLAGCCCLFIFRCCLVKRVSGEQLGVPGKHVHWRTWQSTRKLCPLVVALHIPLQGWETGSPGTAQLGMSPSPEATTQSNQPKPHPQGMPLRGPRGRSWGAVELRLLKHLQGCYY